MGDRMLTMVLGLVATTACCGLLSSPEKVAMEYLETGEVGEPDDVSHLVQEGCTDESILGVSAVKAMGIPMQIETLEVKTDEQDGSHAVVSYKLTGSVQGEGGEARLEGLAITTGSLEIEQMTREGTLELVREGLSWKIACP